MDFHQIWGSTRGPPNGSLCKILAIFKLQKFFNLGSKKFFSGGPTPKPEVKLVEMGGGICRPWGGVSDGEKIFAEIPRDSEILEVKERLSPYMYIYI